MTKNVISAMTARNSVTTKMICVGALSVGMFAPNLKNMRMLNKSQRQPVIVKAPRGGSRLRGEPRAGDDRPGPKSNFVCYCPKADIRKAHALAPTISNDAPIRIIETEQ
jgi:hypothetical protein